MITATEAPCLSDGAERFLSTLAEHGMYHEGVHAARRMPLTVRITWSTTDGASGTIDCIAFSTLDAINLHQRRMLGAQIMAEVIGRGLR